MSHVLTSIPPTFLAASIIIAVTPGPGVIYIVTRSATQGRPAGLASVAGVAVGNLGNAVAASLGLATLFAISTLAFTLVKYAGALYPIYLGVRTIRSRPTPLPAALQFRSASLKRIFIDGLLVALFNPKTAIFFAAFVPQFLDVATATTVGTVARCRVCPGCRNDRFHLCARGGQRTRVVGWKVRARRRRPLP